MRIWFDTEFIEDGQTIDLISIGMIRSDGATYYAESAEANLAKADDWVQRHVVSQLVGPRKHRAQIANELVAFAGPQPEFWADYGAYDWVALCQLYGRMMVLPKGWPMFVRDLRQFAEALGNPRLPKQTSAEHHALNDAIWTRDAWRFLRSRTFAA